MEKIDAMAFLDQEINARYDTQGDRRKFLDFIVNEESFIEGDCETADSRVHVEGSYIFSPDLELRIAVDGIWDHERTMRERGGLSRKNEISIKYGHEPYHHYIDHVHEFTSYSLEAVVRTSRQDYLDALKKLMFIVDKQFVNGRLRIRHDFNIRMINFINGIENEDNPFELFTEIRLFGEVGLLEDFVRLGIVGQLDDVKKQLERKISELGLHRYLIEYETMSTHAISFQDGNFQYVPHATAKYENIDTGVGFEIHYSPAAVLDIKNPASHYRWAVTIPSDTNKQLQDVYNKRFKTPNVDSWSHTDFDYFEKREYAATIKGRIHYFSGDEETFLQTFARWERALYIMKHGGTKALKPSIFENYEHK